MACFAERKAWDAGMVGAEKDGVWYMKGLKISGLGYGTGSMRNSLRR
jgi:hypothetical protein